jgi:pimeloyl-ACP methyl ester carboxylesterase
MPKVKTDSILVEYETFGKISSEPVLLISGLGAQMIRWADEFCKTLSESGFYVIRFDNRDVGLSTKFDELGIPDIIKIGISILKGEKVSGIPYSLEDMAKDVVNLLDFLEIKSAHIVGMSMGGMIAQEIAINFPEIVRSLTSIMSTTGNPDIPTPKPEIIASFLRKPSGNKEEIIKNMVEGRKLLHGTKFPFNYEYEFEDATRNFDRSSYSDGILRQLVAIMTQRNRKELLKEIKVPTLIIHGSEDPLIALEGGMDTVEAIEESELLVIYGMGHNLPREIWRKVINAIKKNADKAIKIAPSKNQKIRIESY